jgi:hypothetical protein
MTRALWATLSPDTVAQPTYETRLGATATTALVGQV